MKHIINLIDKKFGKLKVIKYAGRKQSGTQFKTYWLCECDCGNKKDVCASELKNGHTISCGCFHKEMVGNLNRKHGLANKCGRIYDVWKSIKYRCNNPNNKSYKNYGGRGIRVCDEWQNDFMSFYNWAISSGYKEEKLPNGLNLLTIDRINNDGNYEPSNCRWVTNAENAKNKKRKQKNV